MIPLSARTSRGLDPQRGVTAARHAGRTGDRSLYPRRAISAGAAPISPRARPLRRKDPKRTWLRRWMRSCRDPTPVATVDEGQLAAGHGVLRSGHAVGGVRARTVRRRTDVFRRAIDAIDANTGGSHSDISLRDACFSAPQDGAQRSPPSPARHFHDSVRASRVAQDLGRLSGLRSGAQLRRGRRRLCLRRSGPGGSDPSGVSPRHACSSAPPDRVECWPSGSTGRGWRNCSVRWAYVLSVLAKTRDDRQPQRRDRLRERARQHRHLRNGRLPCGRSSRSWTGNRLQNLLAARQYRLPLCRHGPDSGCDAVTALVVPGRVRVRPRYVPFVSSVTGEDNVAAGQRLLVVEHPPACPVCCGAGDHPARVPSARCGVGNRPALLPATHHRAVPGKEPRGSRPASRR